MPAGMRGREGNMKKKLLGLVACVATLALSGALLAGCSGSGDKTGGDSADGKETLTVGFDQSYPPYGFVGDDGKFTGFDIELWETIAKKLGLGYTFQPMDFNGIIPGLQTGNVDVGIAGMTITPERAKVVLFSDGYYTSGLKILVRDGEKNINKLEDLAGKVVAVKTGTSSVPFMKDFGKAKELKQFPNNDGMFFELLSRGVDAVVFDMPVVTAFANSAGKGKAKVVGPLYEGQKYGIGFAQGSEALVKKVNEALAQMRKDGSYAKLYEKWFGFAPKESDM